MFNTTVTMNLSEKKKKYMLHFKPIRLTSIFTNKVIVTVDFIKFKEVFLIKQIYVGCMLKKFSKKNRLCMLMNVIKKKVAEIYLFE